MKRTDWYLVTAVLLALSIRAGLFVHAAALMVDELRGGWQSNFSRMPLAAQVKGIDFSRAAVRPILPDFVYGSENTVSPVEP